MSQAATVAPAGVIPDASDIDRWLAEDIGAGDVTANVLVPPSATARARLLFREPGVLCGLEAFAAVLRRLDPDLVWHPLARDGDRIQPGVVATLEARARALLAGERLALNLLGYLSGVATLTRRFVDAVEGTGVTIRDTRKTSPGLRSLEKAAVRCGGGENKRMGLYDAVLIKDNHIHFAGGVGAAVVRARRTGLEIEIECETLDQVAEAAAAGADSIILDNMTPTRLREAVVLVAGRASIEASGGATLDAVRAIAETGVNAISVGALTHSVRTLNVSLEIES